MTLTGRTALVTGAAGDIGRATAVRLAAAGAAVVLSDVADDGLERAADLCATANRSTAPTTTTFDVVDATAVQDAFDHLAAQGIVPDLLVNNAGYQGHIRNVIDYAIDDFRRVLDVNVTGLFAVLRCFARTLVATGRPGAVVNMASMAQAGAPNMAAYSASKAAVIALTKTAAKDLAARSIRVNSVSPAFIGPGAMWDRQVELQAQTPSQYYADTAEEVARQMLASVPMGRFGSVDEVASAVHFLLSDDSSYVTGFDLQITGGAN